MARRKGIRSRHIWLWVRGQGCRIPTALPPTIPFGGGLSICAEWASLGHHAEWVHACKTGDPTLCNFDYSGKLIEHNLLGNVAYRTGKKLEWDAKNLKATNAPEADKFIRREYREGWTL